MGKITILKDKLIFERRDELTVIEAYGENCLRCRSTKNSKLLDENWTLLPPASESAVSYTHLTLPTKRIV